MRAVILSVMQYMYYYGKREGKLELDELREDGRNISNNWSRKT